MPICGIAALLATAQSNSPGARLDIHPTRADRAANAEGKQARNVEQIGLITGLAEVGANYVVGHKLNGAKPVGKMDRKDRDEQ
jgi:hypothetical protein